MRLLLLLCVTAGLIAQTVPSRVTLPGHVNWRANAANDRGRAGATLQLNHVLIVLKPTAAQQADLEQLLVQQQDPGSPNFHKWLTPEEYGARFGATQSEIDAIASWLGGSNLKVDSVARGRNTISFSGNVRQVERAFATEIHNYSVNGEMHFANSTDPSVPAALAGRIQTIHGLTDFRMKSHAKGFRAAPNYTAQTVTGVHYLAPDDTAALYDIKALHDAGITGAGQKIVVVGQTNIYLSDIQQFRSYFNLPANVPQLVLVPSSPDPGYSSNDLTEADLDVELSGAVAPAAQVIYVYSIDVVASAQYAIDQNLGTVLSMSYGDCESQTALPGPNNILQQAEDPLTLQTFARQANVQGITWMSASGDTGAADCYRDGLSNNGGAVAAVDVPGSIPEVTSVGGTELNEGTGTYFTASNDPNHSSLYAYVPEMAWNDSVIDGSPSASGGGASTIFPKPTWQTGPGVPADGFRDVPDVSFSSSADHVPSMFITGGALGFVGGTSVAAPNFAGIVALLNQYLVVNGYQKTPGVGNVNPRLYQLAQSAPSAFHDITVGSNIVNGCSTKNCRTGSVGFNAGPGYDQATGLGSLDVFNLVTSWPQTTTTTTAAKATATVSVTQLAAPNAQNYAFQVTVTAADGGTPTGTVTLTSAGATIATGTLSAGTSTVTVPTTKLTAGFDSVSVSYSGDTKYSTAAGNTAITVASSTTTFISAITNAASFKQAYSVGQIMAVFGNLLAGSTLSAPTVPLPTTLGGVSATINGIAAPLYFVSPSQINLQIPYGLSTQTPATLVVTYNGQSASASFPVSANSPGIFLDSTGAPAGVTTAKRGQTIAIYITGQGAVTPQPAAGSLPATGTTPKPNQNVVVEVGGISAPTPYLYIGTPAWAIGLTQINFTVPTNAPLGLQPILVGIGTAISAPAMITVTQ
jgi:uncharacterized protein (TIGR03437 family)